MFVRISVGVRVSIRARVGVRVRVRARVRARARARVMALPGYVLARRTSVVLGRLLGHPA